MSTEPDRRSVPQVGDTITTAERLDALPSLTIVVDANDEVQQRHGHLATDRGDYSAWLGVMPPTCKPSPEVALPATVLYVPGEQPCRHCGSCDGPPSCPDCDHADRPSVTDNARAAAEQRYPALNSDDEELTYPRSAVREHARGGFVAGYKAGWAAGRAETTTGAIARGEALAAGDPDWMNVTRWPRAETTAEDAEEVLHGAGWFARADLDPRVLHGILHDLADAGLLATTRRTRPTRDDISDAIEQSGIAIGTSDAERAADAVLALLRDGA